MIFSCVYFLPSLQLHKLHSLASSLWNPHFDVYLPFFMNFYRTVFFSSTISIPICILHPSLLFHKLLTPASLHPDRDVYFLHFFPFYLSVRHFHVNWKTIYRRKKKKKKLRSAFWLALLFPFHTLHVFLPHIFQRILTVHVFLKGLKTHFSQLFLPLFFFFFLSFQLSFC